MTDAYGHYDAADIELPTAASNAKVGNTSEHRLDIIHEEQLRRSWYLSWRCTHKGCDTRGNATLPNRDKALALFAILADGHHQLAAA